MNDLAAHQRDAYFSAEVIAEARKRAAETGRPLVEILQEQAGLEARDFVSAFARSLAIAPVTMDELSDLSPALEVLPFAVVLQEGCVAARTENGDTVVVISNPLDSSLKARLEERVQIDFDWRLAHSSDLAVYIKRLEDSFRAVAAVVDDIGYEGDEETKLADISLRNLGDDDESFVVRVVNSTLYDAIKADASDIHFETQPRGLIIKYRLDGVLVKASAIDSPNRAEQIISRIKVMGELDITERRVPQDGRFKVSVDQRPIDFRVSVMPSVHGEDAVVRILDKKALIDQSMQLRLDSLGFDERTVATMRKLSREAYGMILVTGPTGSGKTTTLYAAITEINNGEDKIITIEDPVEYQLPEVLQIPVNEKKGLTFARGLRSILRHDPDKILVGEIRDSETAEIAVQAALTGHLVFTTVHANNVFDVIERFTHMGVEPHSFVSAMNAVVAQRLVRLNCPQCIKEYIPAPELLAESNISDTDIRHFTFRAGTGCGHCRGTGYKGRKAVAEVLLMSEEIRELIIARAPARALRDAAGRAGTIFLREGALDLVRRGETTLQAVNRVTLA